MAPSASRGPGRGKLGAAGAVVALHVLVFVAVLNSRVSPSTATSEGGLKVFALPEPEPPPDPPSEPPPRPTPPAAKPVPATGGAPQRAKQPPGPRSAAPTLVPVPRPVTAAPAPAPAPSSGVGQGSRSGSRGGTGSGGGEGNGNGAGAGWTPARLIKGEFRGSDFPRAAREAPEVRLSVRFAVQPDGRVGGCEVTRTSGYPELDAITCPVIRRRFRFAPARDDQGEPVTEVIEEEQTWSAAR